MSKRDIPRIPGQTRDRSGTRYANRLRNEGRLPGIVYGHKQDPVPLSVDYKQLVDLLHLNYHLIELEVDGKVDACLVKDVQWNYLGTKIVHIDLARVDLSEQVEVEVSIELTGEPAALQEAGAVLSQPLTSIELRCRADEIPESIIHDVSELEAGHSITVSDLTLPEGVVAVTDPETLVAQIQIQEELPEEEPAVAATEEPEVIGQAEEKEEEQD